VRQRAGGAARRFAHASACATLAALIFLCLCWELWLAPLRPGGSWLALKALPLLAPLVGVLRARVYTVQWSLLLILAYLAEGVVRASSDTGTAARLAQLEIALVIAYFASAVGFVRLSRSASGTPRRA
jgi:uncharacterized membrane protein